ncbi:MAG: hypothetical protein HYZ72_15025, partial [Deltaproteobacteria bacterium]|nr:hypothetical protein [Deltaproteobacteria bacterium]
MKTKGFFRANLCNLGFFDSLNTTLHRIAARWRFRLKPKSAVGRRAGGLPAQEELWGYLADGLVILLHTPETGEWERMRELMRQY